MTILVITTGGTIGAMPYDDPTKPPEFITMPADDRDLVSEVVNTTFAAYKAPCVSLTPRDSKLIDDAYRNDILSIIMAARESRILITHGTDTILQSADFFYQQVVSNRALDGKTILLTGTMTPLSNGRESDGFKNLSFSLHRLAEAKRTMARVNIVLCDFETKKNWTPQLYKFKPNRYKKQYMPDGRYNRLVQVPEVS